MIISLTYVPLQSEKMKTVLAQHKTAYDNLAKQTREKLGAMNRDISALKTERDDLRSQLNKANAEQASQLTNDQVTTLQNRVTTLEGDLAAAMKRLNETPGGGALGVSGMVLLYFPRIDPSCSERR